jgi:manganese/zinc/iron transport system permease protein
MIALAAGFGGASGALGAMLSAVFSDLPSGAMIVLVAGTLFFISLLGGAAHGTLVRAAQQWQLNRKVDRQHLLRAMYELRESERAFSTGTAATMDTGGKPVSLAELLPMRSWSARRLRRVIRRQLAEGTMAVSPTGEGFHLAPRGWAVAAELVRRHRLWELYLIERAEIAPSLVDRDADAIEHLLDAEMVARLEKMLAPARGGTTLGVPSSPHPIPLLPGEQQGPGPGGDT